MKRERGCQMIAGENISDDLWREYEDYVRKICSYRLIKRPEYIDDCVQEILLALSEALHKKKRIRNPKAWLTKVAYNKTSDISDKIRKEDELFVPFNSDVVSGAYSVQLQIETGAENEILLLREKVLFLLDVDERKLLCDRYELEKSISEIANECGISENNVYQRLYRLRIKTKMLIKSCLDEQDANFL